MYETEGEGTKHLFNELLNDAGLDAHEIVKALDNSIELGFVNWGQYRGEILKLISNPEPKDLVGLITRSESILKPLEEWVMMERKINALRRESITKYEYYATEYRCSQIQNFILYFKLY